MAVRSTTIEVRMEIEPGSYNVPVLLDGHEVGYVTGVERTPVGSKLFIVVDERAIDLAMRLAEPSPLKIHFA